MKKAISLLVMLCMVNVYSQKIKVKKGTLSIDKKEVCKFIETERNQYTIKDIEDNLVCELAFISETAETLNGTELIKYLKFNKPNSTEDYYSDYDISGLKFSFSGEKTLVRHLIKKNQFLSSTGLNVKNIEEFFAQSRPKSTKIEDKKKEYIEAYKAVTNFNLKFDKNAIYKVGKKDTLVGSYGTKFLKNMNYSRITVYDAKAFVVATYDPGTISLFDGQKIKYAVSLTDANEKAQKIVERLIIAGYTLGDMQAKKALIRIKNRQKGIAAEKGTSTNIYNEAATVYDTEENSFKGELKIEFNELESTKSNISSLTNYGGVAMLKTTKENGKFKYTDYKAKNGVRFCLDDTKECYQGIKTVGMTAPKFNLEVNTKGKLKLYKSFSFNYYILKKEGTEKGLVVGASKMFQKENSIKQFEEVYEYLSDCPAIKDSINPSTIDLKKVADLEKIITAYNSCN